MTGTVRARCALHGLTEHTYTAAETVRLLELFSDGDWEDGPRCPREILAGEDLGTPYQFDHVRRTP